MPLPADLDSLDPAVGNQLRERYAEVDRRVATAAAGASDASRARLGRAFGELGQTLAAYRYWPPARAAFANAERLDPAPQWSYYLGHAERGVGHFAASTAAFERYLADHPEDVPALVWLGEGDLELGRLDEARTRFARALELAPNCVRALFGLGRVALELGNAEAAATHLEAASRQQPGSSRIRYSLATALRLLGEGDRAAALFDAVDSDHRTEVPIALDDPLMAAVNELRRGALAHERRGLRAAARGEMRRAVFELQQAVALDPERFEAWHNLGLALLRLGRREEGERELRRLLQRFPQHAPTHLLLGNLAADSNELEEAERRFRSAIAADPRLPGAHQALATLLRRAGRQAEAREHAARVVELQRGVAGTGGAGGVP
ncbi:MAG: tetratricopeptide repeat protein [Acidobacteriota bacterium]